MALAGIFIFLLNLLILKRRFMGFFNNRYRAFGYAFKGLASAFRNELHVKLHALVAILVVGFGFYCHVTATEWILLLGCISLVICTELINSALERLCNLVSPEQHPAVKYIKDVAAAAVLISCILAVITGLLVFWPYVSI
jgi:diacylglycerol kinase (ATP)